MAELVVKIGWDTWEEEGIEGLPTMYRRYVIPGNLYEDIVHWLEWAEKMNDKIKKREE